MTRRKTVGLVIGLVVILGIGLVIVRLRRARQAGTEVRLEAVARRDIVSVVTASGPIEAKTSVDISADITGRIVRIAVDEGDLVRRGAFLLQIDPAQYQAAVARAEGVVASTRAAVLQMKASRDQTSRDLARAEQLAAVGNGLIAAQEVEQARTAAEVAEANHQASTAQLAQAEASLQEAKDNLAKTRLVAPMSGRVVRVAVEEGEVAVPSTFSRETGLLMTIADLSVMMAKVKVNETDVVRLSVGDSAAVTIDAYPDSTFAGRVTRISHSARLSTAASTSTDQAVDFDVEITLDRPAAGMRPDLSSTARIVTDIKPDALALPIIALTTRPHERLASELAPDIDTAGGSRRRDEEGVFVVRAGVAYFHPVQVGVAGEEHFEVVRGLQAGDTIVAGSYQTIRDLRDSTRVHAADTTGTRSGL